MSRLRFADEGDMIASTDRLIALIGEPAVRRLSEDFGGVRLYVPAQPGAHHPLTHSVGQEAADVLAQAFSGQELVVPITPARRGEILELDRKGWTRAKIARKVRLTERRVYQVLEAARRAAPATRTLFD